MTCIIRNMRLSPQEMPNQHPITIDIVILSYAKDQALKLLTERTIASCLDSEDPAKIHFNIVVIESNQALSPFQFQHSKTIYPEVKFGFHRYLNIGLNNTSSDYICLCNNDLIFHKNWASAILDAMNTEPNMLSASTFCPIMHSNGEFKAHTGAIEGYENLFSGWCFLIKRSLIDKVGLFDENFEFWYADADYLKTLKAQGVKNYLITDSLVSHLNAVTSKSLSRKERFNFTLVPQLYFNYKWKRDSYLKYQLKLLYFKALYLLKIE